MTDHPFITCLWFDTEAEQATMTKFDVAALEQAYSGA
jgi:hypothetical protein